MCEKMYKQQRNINETRAFCHKKCWQSWSDFYLFALNKFKNPLANKIATWNRLQKCSLSFYFLFILVSFQCSFKKIKIESGAKRKLRIKNFLNTDKTQSNIYTNRNVIVKENDKNPISIIFFLFFYWVNCYFWNKVAVNWKHEIEQHK